jgi:hypothetical protein
VTARREESGHRAAALDHGVGGERGPVHDGLDLRDGDAVRPEEVPDPGQHSHGRILRRRQLLGEAHGAGALIHEDEVREGPPDIDAYAMNRHDGS